MGSQSTTRGGDDMIVEQGKPVATGGARQPVKELRPGQLQNPDKQGISNRPGDQDGRNGVDAEPGNDGEDR